MIKAQYLLGRIKLNRIFCELKKLARIAKMNKVKEALHVHSTYKRMLSRILKSWRQYIRARKQVVLMIDKVYIRNQSRKFLQLLYSNYQLLKREEETQRLASSHCERKQAEKHFML